MSYNIRTMMRAAVALLVSVSMLGCFPHNERHRTYAKIAEGGALVGGIVISAVGNTGADCDQMVMPGVDSNCKSNATILSTIGVALILGGLLGFVATVSTAEDDNDVKPVVTRVPDQTPAPKTDPKPADTGSAASEPATAPQPQPAN
ncbi:MAG: hypothetical protein HOV81_38550 [Kofleriaceae bacterium]|nr:hypothetical protein [Kofleriaceae bacterium]